MRAVSAARETCQAKTSRGFGAADLVDPVDLGQLGERPAAFFSFAFSRRYPLISMTRLLALKAKDDWEPLVSLLGTSPAKLENRVPCIMSGDTEGIHDPARRRARMKSTCAASRSHGSARVRNL